MGELRLYAIGIDEVRSMFGAPPELAERLRQQAVVALAPPQTAEHGGLLSKLGPIFRRPPGTRVLDPDDPVPADLDRILAGAFVPAERSVASWRLVELLIKENAWGGTGLSVHGEQLDHLDFALARGGVHAAAGLRHLLNNHTELPLIVPRGLLVGFHTGAEAAWMADSYRQAIEEIEDEGPREMVYALANWLDGFGHWVELAPTMGRRPPDLIGFWGVS
ncbi:MAG TPA: hypothetical protein VIP98_11910 [Microlunatus sp.]